MKNSGHVIFKSKLCIALVAFCSAAGVSAQPAKNCSRISLDTKLLWISSAAWVDSLSKLAVVDPLENAIFLIAPDGKFQTFNQTKLVKSPREMVPAVVESVGDGFLLQMVDQRLFWLDKGLNLVKAGNLAKDSTTTRSRIGSTYDWVTAGDFLVAFGSIKENGHQRFGFYRTPLRALSRVDFLFDFDNVDYYLLGHHYLTGLGRDAYFLLMDKEASIYRVPAGEGGRVVRLKGFPKEYRLIPPIPTISTGLATDELLFKGIEELTIPVGLYGQDDFLYLLTREPRKEGGTRWLLHQINPNKDGGEVVGKVELPTRADHLTVVPSKANWYIFEKGPVLSQSQQKIESMLVIPTSSVRALTVPKSCQGQAK